MHSAANASTKIHVRTERPKTLMRTTVKKPARPKPAVHVSGLVTQPKHTIIYGSSAERQHRATQIVQSKHITRFTHQHASVTKKTAAIAVKAAPVVQAPKKRMPYDIADTPPTVPASMAKKQLHVPQSIFESALATASTHHAKPYKQHRSSRRRAMRLGASALAVLLLISFFAYQNAPRMALRAASSTIGFNASIPGYSPAGFGLSGPVQYKPGQVIISFRSHSDDRAYTLTQAKMDLDAGSWADSYLSSNHLSYQTQTVNDTKVYIYNQSNATWAHNGVWYNLQGNAELSTAQLLHIVRSI